MPPLVDITLACGVGLFAGRVQDSVCVGVPHRWGRRPAFDYSDLPCKAYLAPQASEPHPGMAPRDILSDPAPFLTLVAVLSVMWLFSAQESGDRRRIRCTDCYVSSPRSRIRWDNRAAAAGGLQRNGQDPGQDQSPPDCSYLSKH